jgi:hypothetical protein
MHGRINAALGQKGTMGLFSGLNVLAFVMVFLFVEETKQRTLEELDHIFAVSKRQFISFQVTSYLPWFIKKYLFGIKRIEPTLYRDLVWGSQADESKRAPLERDFHMDDDQIMLKPKPTHYFGPVKYAAESPRPDMAEMDEIYPPGVRVPYGQEYPDGGPPSPGPSSKPDYYGVDR